MASRLLASQLSQSFTCMLTLGIQNKPCVNLWLERNKEELKKRDIKYTFAEKQESGNGDDKESSGCSRNVDFNICVDEETEDLFLVPSKTSLDLNEAYQLMFTLESCGKNKEVEEVVSWLKDSMEVFLKTSRVFKIETKVSEFVTQHKEDTEKIVDKYVCDVSHKIDELDAKRRKIRRALQMENVVLLGGSMLIKLPQAFVGVPEMSKAIMDEMEETFQSLPSFLDIKEDDIQDAIIQATEGDKLLKLKILLYIAKSSVQNFQLIVRKKKQTALHVCKSKEALLDLKKFMGSTDILNSFNNENMTPIYKAFIELKYDCAALFLKMGADTSLTNGKKSLWEIAVEAYVQGKSQGMNFITLLYNKGVLMGDSPVKAFIQSRKYDQSSANEQDGVDLKPFFLQAVTNSQYDDAKVICMLHVQQFVDNILKSKDVLDLDAYRAEMMGHASQNVEELAKAKLQLFTEYDGDGDTCLLIAEKKNDTAMIDLLLKLGADESTTKKEGNTASKSIERMHNFMATPPIHKAPRVLCLDGGGMRGLVEIYMLKRLEEMTGKPIRDLFDFIAGTSTGAILTAALVQGKLTLDDMEQAYLDMGDDIFTGQWPYKSASLIKHTKEIFGEDICLKDLGDEGKEVFICAVNPSDREFLKVITKETYPDYPVWKAVVASASAPTYFEPFYDDENDTSYLDGGLAANNPTLEAIAYLETRAIRPKCVLSLGTGHYIEGALFDKDDFYLGQGCKEMSFISHLSNVKNLLSLIVNTATNAYGLTNLRAQRICKALNVPFLHLDPHLDRNIDLDTTDQKDIEEMKKFANDLVTANVQELEKFKAHLLK